MKTIKVIKRADKKNRLIQVPCSEEVKMMEVKLKDKVELNEMIIEMVRSLYDQEIKNKT